MILALSRFRVRNAMERAVAEAFAGRPGLVDDAPGFLGLEVFLDRADSTIFHLVTRWTDEESFRTWHGSDEHRASHRFIPKGLKLDAAFTQVTVIERLPVETPNPTELALDHAPVLGAFLTRSRLVHWLVAAPDGTVVYCNERAASALERSVEEVLGSDLWGLLVAHDAERVQALVRSGERRPFERTTLNFVPPSQAPYSLTCSVDAQPGAIVIIGEPDESRDQELRDTLLRLNNELAVAARENTRKSRQLESVQEELMGAKTVLDTRVRERTAELSRSNQDLEQFAYVASHDLQEPLRMVVSYLQLLERRYRGRLDSDADEFIDYAVDGAKRMQQLINDLLAYSRVGRTAVGTTPIDLNVVVERATKALETAIEESGAEVTADQLPEVTGDRSQLTLLFQNLIANGVKFRGEAPPKIHIGAHVVDGMVEISVRDNGIGIAPEYFEKIFVIFQRLHGRTEFPGTGIGLALVKKIVETHGGEIRVESEVGKGATFRLTLPLWKGEAG